MCGYSGVGLGAHLSPRHRRSRAFHENDGGFSTVGMVLALLITLSVVCGATQVYRLSTASAGMQNVADAAALAAENEVAEFYIVATVCDAVVLTCSLTGIIAAGLGTAALCTPATAAFSEPLLSAAQSITKARDSFARKAAEGLNVLQRALPFLAAAGAADVVNANNGIGGQRSNFGFAVLMPFEGEPIEVGPAQATESLLDDIEASRTRIQEAGNRAEEAARKASAEKQRAFQADCGNSPGYCMYERARTLAGMEGSDNPKYNSVDSWSFQVALRRAQAYYPQRLAMEHPADSSVDEQARSALRTHFYRNACNQMDSAFVSESDDGTFAAYFPKLPCNTDEMRATPLYTDVLFPASSEDDGSYVVHAWAGCPYYMQHDAAGVASIAQMEIDECPECPVCEFSAVSMGKVAAASTSIDNGFEYYYQIVADAAARYVDLRAQFAPQAAEVKGLFEALSPSFGEALSQAAGYRIVTHPPGRCGAVAIVVDTAGVQVSDMVPLSFADSGGTLGTRVALSAATLAQDDATETKTVISSLLDGFVQQSGQPGPGAVLLDVWSRMLKAYCDGQEALTSGIREAIDAIPFASESGLGTWAAERFGEIVNAVGLQPVNLSAPKPVVVNSSHVIARDEGTFAQTLSSMKEGYAALPGSGTGTVFDVALEAVHTSVMQGMEGISDTFVVAHIEPIGEGGPSLPVSITLPPELTQAANGTVDAAFDAAQGALYDITGERQWK